MNEELEVAKSALHSVNEIVDIKTNPMVDFGLMSIIKTVPVIGDMLESSTNKLIDEFQQKKEKELIEVILKDKYSITSEMVNDVEFIVNFARTKEAVQRLATNDKVEYFGNLIRNGYLTGEHMENNEFEEYLNMLSSMSNREIKYLVFLKEHPVGKNEISSWSKFEQLFYNEFGKENENPYFCFLRLKRTGFVDEKYCLESTSVSKDNRGDYELDFSDIDSNGFSTTASFDRFCNMIIG